MDSVESKASLIGKSNSEYPLVMNLLSLYVLFSHFRPRDATRGNSFFQMLSYARANVRKTIEKHNGKIPIRASRGLKWEKNVQAKKVYFLRATREKMASRFASVRSEGITQINDEPVPENTKKATKFGLAVSKGNGLRF